MVATVPLAAEPQAAEDGRRARRERNRNAVVEALLELFRDGNLAPSTDEVAERAGLSPRSVFRYFDDVDDLCRAAIGRQQERVAAAMGLTVDVEAPLAVRIGAVVDQRLRLFEAMGAVGQVLRIRAPFQPLLAAELARARHVLREQHLRAFAPELSAMGPTRAMTAAAAVDALCSFESYQLIRFDQGLSVAATATVLTEALTRLLGSGSG